MSQIDRSWLKFPVSSKSNIHDSSSNEEPGPPSKSTQSRSRSATISGRFLTTTLPKRLSKPSSLQATEAVIFRLKPIKEGYLIYKRKKRWTILDDINFYIFKSTEDYNPPNIIPLQCCKARSLGKDVNGFEIITSIHTYQFFEDKDSNNFHEWIPQIETVCNNLVMDSIGGKKDKNILTKTYSKIILEEDIGSAQITAIEIAMREDNKTCADCGAPAPEWASTNLGIIICIDCSGIHRSFGTHISKVRSVKLDKWDTESTLLIDSIGNRKANQYWEHFIPPSFSRITPTSKLHDRKIWLQFKYIKKRFTPDWKESDDDNDVGFDSSTGTVINKNHKKLLELKNAADELRFRDFKSTFVQLLQEDEDFKDEMRVLLFSDIDLSALKPFIIPTSDISPESSPSPMRNSKQITAPISLSSSPSSSIGWARGVSPLTLSSLSPQSSISSPVSPSSPNIVHSPNTSFPPPVIGGATKIRPPPLTISKSSTPIENRPTPLKSLSSGLPAFPPPVIPISPSSGNKSPKIQVNSLPLPSTTVTLESKPTFPPPVFVSSRGSDSPKFFPPPTLLSPTTNKVNPAFPPPVIPISPKLSPTMSRRRASTTFLEGKKAKPTTSFPPPLISHSQNEHSSLPEVGTRSPVPSLKFPPPVIAINGSLPPTPKKVVANGENDTDNQTS